MSPDLLQHPNIPCQRWNRGRDRYLRDHPDNRFDRRKYSVDVIPERMAREFVEREHYSHSYPAACFRAGLFGVGGELVGVAVFSQSMNQAVVPAHCGVPASDGLELGRFVLLDSAPANAETYFLGRAFRLLRQGRPQTRAIVSYSDPLPRHDAEGRVVKPGHIGKIYAAHNAEWKGRSAARTLHITAGGLVLSPRTLSKIRLGEAGADSAARTLIEMGAPSRCFGESPAEWVSRILQSDFVQAVRHPGNHVWAWSLDRRRTPAQGPMALPLGAKLAP